MDLGAKDLHCVAVDAAYEIVDARVLHNVEDAVAWVIQARAVAIDAPAALSRAPRFGDPSVSRKFQNARCAEIELGRRHHLWVPWPTPTDEMAVLPWMRLGFRLFASLSAVGLHPIEVYPHGAFRHLAQRRLANKRSAAGAAERISLLQTVGYRRRGWKCGRMTASMHSWPP